MALAKMLPAVILGIVLLMPLHGPRCGLAKAQQRSQQQLYDANGLLECVKPKYGKQMTHTPFDVPDWEMYSKLDEQTDRVYALVEQAVNRSMLLKRLHSEGAPSEGTGTSEPYEADIDLVTFERMGISGETQARIEGIKSDDSVLDWVKGNDMAPWMAGDTDVTPVTPRSASREPGDKVRIVIGFGEHGREIITTELGEHFIRLLSNATLENLAPVFEGDEEMARKVVSALDNSILHMIPCENKGGRAVFESGQYCERKNGRGVDINRNWPVHFGFKEPDYDPKEEYPGSEPLSEPESRIMFRILEATKPDAFISIHSGMHGMFVPPDHLPVLEDSIANLAEVKILGQLNDDYIDSRSTIGAAGHAVGYVAHGTATDFYNKGFDIPSVQTWEIFGDEKAHYKDCFTMFNPKTTAEFDEYMRRWSAALLAYISAMHEQMVPGINGADSEAFSQDVARMKTPKACGLTQYHVDLMTELSQKALTPADPAKEEQELPSGDGDAQETGDSMQQEEKRLPERASPLPDGQDIYKLIPSNDGSVLSQMEHLYIAALVAIVLAMLYFLIIRPRRVKRAGRGAVNHRNTRVLGLV